MNIYSIRGGGTRGLITIILLKKIEEVTKKSISELFHFAAGSSVGSLLASALLLSEDGVTHKYTAHQVYELFLKHVHNSFTWSYGSYIMSGFGLWGAKYNNIGLNNIITECCGDT